MKFRNIYSSREETAKDKKAVVFKQDSMTDQRFKDDCSIQSILARYRVTGDLAHLGYNPNGVPLKPFKEGDFADIGDYQECLELVMSAKEQFDALPSNIRKEVGNTPEGMLKFINDPKNYERGVELGIFEKRVENLDIVNGGNIGDNSVGTVSDVNTGEVK